MKRFYCDKCDEVLEEQAIKNPSLIYSRDGTPDIKMRPDLCPDCEFHLWGEIKKIVRDYGHQGG